jgi:AraC-like DNA-binding protein
MKALVQKLPLSEDSSFVAGIYTTPYFETPWHYHIEFEILLILEGGGKKFVGDHISDFKVGDLYFLGPNLPHLFRKDSSHAVGSSLVIHFTEDFIGQDFLKIPEMKRILSLFEKSKKGMHFHERSYDIIKQKLIEILELKGMPKLLCVISILEILSGNNQYDLLCESEITGKNTDDSEIINKTFDYILKNFKDEVSIGKAAEDANMSIAGFSRYFKNRTKKNFSSVLNEIRIGYACRLLIEKNRNVTEICYKSGFNNITNFNKQFKKIKKTTPKKFQFQYH